MVFYNGTKMFNVSTLNIVKEFWISELQKTLSVYISEMIIMKETNSCDGEERQINIGIKKKTSPWARRGKEAEKIEW